MSCFLIVYKYKDIIRIFADGLCEIYLFKTSSYYSLLPRIIAHGRKRSFCHNENPRAKAVFRHCLDKAGKSPSLSAVFRRGINGILKVWASKNALTLEKSGERLIEKRLRYHRKALRIQA